MKNVPKDCLSCPYESSCNTAMAFSDCRFYFSRNEKISIKAYLKNLFGKVFH